MAMIRRYPDLLVALLVIVLYGGTLLFLHNPTSLDDGIRHIMMAKAMAAQGSLTLDWSTFLSYGSLAHIHTDPWWLSDVLLIPIAHAPIEVAQRMVVGVMLICIVASALVLLRSFRTQPIVSAALLLILLCGETNFIGRMMLARPLTWIVCLTMIVIWAIVERRWLTASLCVFLSVLLSQLWVFPVFLIGISLACFARFHDWKNLHRGFVAAVGATVLGIALHPGSVEYLRYLLNVFLHIPLHPLKLSVEMQPGLVHGSFVTVLILCLCAILLLLHRFYVRRKRSFDVNGYFLLASTVVFVLCFLVWVRSIDVLLPLLASLIAYLLHDDASLADHIRLKITQWVHASPAWVRVILTATVVLQILSPSLSFLRDDAANDLRYFSALQVLPTESTVLNMDWTYFPAQLAVRPDLQFSLGIDPSFTAFTDPDQWVDIHYLKQKGSDLSAPKILSTIDRIVSRYPADAITLSRPSFSYVIQILDQSEKWHMVADSGKIVVFVQSH